MSESITKIEKIRNRYIEFMNWDENSVDTKLMTISSEYSFFQSMYYESIKKLTQAEKEHDEMWQGKYRLYKFDYDMSLSHTEIKQFIEKDNDIIGKRVEVKKIKDFSEFLGKCLENINQLRWDLKSFIDWKKFKAGL
jgi:hypothetical protein